MTQEQIEKLSVDADILFQRLDGWQDRTLQAIGRRIKAIGKLSAHDQQALKNIADITGDMSKITKDLARITGMNISDLKKIYSGALSDQADTYKPLYDFRSMPYVPFAENEYAQQLVVSFARQTAHSMINLSKTSALGFVKYDLNGNEVGFKSLRGAFQDAIDTAVLNVSTGTEDFNIAMKNTIEQLGGSGIKTKYISENGRETYVRLDSMVRQNILYGAKQSAQAYDEYVGEQLGCDGFEVDAHSNPRPSHEFMQGKMFSYSGDKTIDGVIYLDGGQALNALNDFGCLHFKTDVILGISEPRYSEKYLDELHRKNSELIEYGGEKRTGYEWKQRQRLIERTIRQNKDKAVLAEAAGNKELAARYRKNIKVLKDKYDDLSDSVGLTKTPERMATFTEKISKNYNVADENEKAVDNNANNDIIKIEKPEAISKIRQTLDESKVEYREVQPLKSKLTIPQIIERLGGGDLTEGSCSSLAFAYSGNINGLDVLDFRGGVSCSIFSSNYAINEIAKLPGVNGTVLKDYNDFTAVKKLLKTVETGKDYYLGTGEHAAIIRKTKRGFEYLELQDPIQNGFKKLTPNVLKRRFYCQKSYTVAGMKVQAVNQLIECQSLKNSDEFKKILGYINTAEESQRKGGIGSVK